MIKLVHIKDFAININDNLSLNLENFEIKSRDRIYCHGPSGSGKSSFFKAIFCLEDFHCKSIETHQKKISKHELRKLFCYIGQDSYFENITLKEIFDKIRKHSWFEFNYDLFIDLLNLRSLKNKLNQKLKILSGGEKQYFLTSLSISSNAPILLFDETFSAMDEKLLKLSEKVILDNQKDKAIVFIHHFKDKGLLSPNKEINFSSCDLNCHQIS